MVDREKIIKALELCTSKIETRTQIPCETCSYHNRKYHGVLGDGCCNVRSLQRDALALLKAQEPRVMTLSGVRNLKQNTPVWLEDVDKKDVIGALFMRDYSGTKCVDFAIVRDWEHERVTADYMDYGIRWRVWTSRPDQATREATPWE